MCGRYDLHSAPRTVGRRYELLELNGYRPSYNIAPTQPIAGITQHEDGRHLDMYRWGLVPMWAKEIGRYSTINARAETVDEKPAFKGPFRHHRCLIPADGYYEWQQIDKRKQPWYIHPKDGQGMAFAGLFDIWMSPEGDELRSATIIVKDAGVTTKTIHDRMPVVLPPEAWDTWLSKETPKKDLHALLQSANDDALTMYPVSTWVNDAHNNDVSCIFEVPI
jgi:putative SOS response-associated peptidase YedK